MVTQRPAATRFDRVPRRIELVSDNDDAGISADRTHPDRP
jgi:hypothetical protein